MEIQDNIRNLVANAKIEAAIEAFSKFADEQHDEDLSNQLIMLKGRYNALKRNENLGLISFADASRDRAQISNSILSLCNQIGDASSTSATPSRGNSTTTTPSVNAAKTSKKILFLASNPSDTGKLQLDKEFRQVFHSVQEGTLDYEMVVEWAITPSDLQRVILKHKPTILHFSGHGEGSKTEKVSGTGSISKSITVPAGIVLEDNDGHGRLVSGVALAGLFGICLRKFNIELVVLNACHSEDQAKSIAQAGVAFVVGMNTAVNDGTAIEFSTGLYRGVATEGDIEFAFDLAKNNILLMGLEGDNIPVLYKKG